MTRSYYWKPLNIAKAQNVNPELWDRGIIHRLHREGIIIDSPLNIYTGFEGRDLSIRLFVGDDPREHVYVESDSLTTKMRAVEALRQQNVYITQLVSAGLQRVEHEIQDSYRHSLERFVEGFSSHPQARPA